MTGPVITVDGPSASGKSTVARRVAAALGYRHVDSGALYRAVTRLVIESGLAPGNAAAVAGLLGGFDAVMEAENGEVIYILAGKRPDSGLRAPAVASAVSLVAAQPAVRAWVNRALRRAPELGGIVMDGRDIGSVVFPEARHKFYLDASPEVRALRRYAERAGDGAGSDLAGVREALRKRDAQDQGRVEAPLAVPAGARVIDTSALALDAVVAAVMDGIREVERERA